MFEPLAFRPLGELVDLRMGGTPSRAEPDFWDRDNAGHPWVSIGDIKGKYISRTKESVTKLGARAARLSVVPPGVPIMSFKLSMGRAAIPAVPVYTNEAIVALFPKPGISFAKWLYYSVPRVVQSAVTETAVKGQTLNLKKLRELPVPTPSTLEEQRRIAEILDALDARIRCQDQVIAKLVAVQQGLESSLLDMPDIPSESLANYLASSPKNGYSPKEVDEWTGMVALGLGCLTANGFQPRQLKNVPSGDARNVGAVLRDGDLLMSRANTRELVGLVGIYKDVGYDCIYPDLMMRLTPTKRCRVGYLELVLRSSTVRRQIQGMAQGTSESMVKISSSIVQDLKVQIPDLAAQDRILEVVDAARARRDAEEAVRDGLLRLKAGLAEDLLTGRVRVPEAEAVVESL